MANSISNLGLPINSASITTTVGSNGSSRVRPTYSPTEKELIFEFLKQNMRVAEYRDGNGKIESVELQLRLDSGYEWESVNRTRILRSKFTP